MPVRTETFSIDFHGRKEMKFLILILVSIFCINASAQVSDQTFVSESEWVSSMPFTQLEEDGMSMMTITDSLLACRSAHLACEFQLEDRDVSKVGDKYILKVRVEFNGIKQWRLKCLSI